MVILSPSSILVHAVHTISGDKYVNLDFFPKTLGQYLPDEKRAGGYDFDYVLSFEDELSLTISADKKFSDIPEKLELNFDGYAFKGEYLVNGNKLTLKKNLAIKKSIITKADLSNWKKFLESIKQFSGHFFSVTDK